MHNVPEEDSWVYPTLRNDQAYESDVSICNVFVCKIWREAGVFDNIGQWFFVNGAFFPWFSNVKIKVCHYGERKFFACARPNVEFIL